MKTLCIIKLKVKHLHLLSLDTLESEGLLVLHTGLMFPLSLLKSQSE